MQQLKEWQTLLRQLRDDSARLKESLDELQQSLPGVQDFANGIERDVKKWQFKTKPRLDRIQVILDVLKIDQQEQHK